MMGVEEYFTGNSSWPKTPGLRARQDKAALDELLAAVTEARGAGPPVFLKVAPDLDSSEIGDIVEVSMARRIDALIVSNTTISRPHLKSKHHGETGSLSGAPHKGLPLQRLKHCLMSSRQSLPPLPAGGRENG